MNERLDRLGRRVGLRDVTEQDLEDFYEHQCDPVANEKADFPARAHDAHLAHWQRILADETVIARTVTVDGKTAGNVVSWVNGDGACEVGFWLGREFWDAGVGTAALEAFLRNVGRHPLLAHVATANVASRRVLEKCGFVVAGGDEGEVLLRLDQDVGSMEDDG